MVDTHGWTWLTMLVMLWAVGGFATGLVGASPSRCLKHTLPGAIRRPRPADDRVDLKSLLIRF